MSRSPSPSKRIDWVSVVLASLVGLLALGVVVGLVVKASAGGGTPKPHSETSSSVASGGATTEPSPTASDDQTIPLSSPSPTSTALADNLAVTDPADLVMEAARGYESGRFEATGATLTLNAADGQNFTVSYDLEGNYRATTENPIAPEWLLFEGALYGKMGEAEINIRKDDFQTLGKPNATWTDTATIANTQRRVLSASDIAAAAADLTPRMKNVTVTPQPDGTIFVEGLVPAAGSEAYADIYNLDTTATVVFSINPYGRLSGYTVAPINGDVPLTVTVDDYGPVTVSAPDSREVITQSDLELAARLMLASNVQQSASPSPSPSPSRERNPERGNR